MTLSSLLKVSTYAFFNDSDVRVHLVFLGDWFVWFESKEIIVGQFSVFGSINKEIIVGQFSVFGMIEKKNMKTQCFLL